MREYKDQIDILRQELSHSKQKLFHLNNESEQTITPSVEAEYELLLSKINIQKDENATLQKQLTELKKEKSILSQSISSSMTRIAQLEQQIGP